MEGCAYRQYIFLSYSTSTLNAVQFDKKNPFSCQCETEDKKADGFRISHFDWLFSSDVMAVMGLNTIYIVHSPCLELYG